jgi:hypothetical protein
MSVLRFGLLAVTVAAGCAAPSPAPVHAPHAPATAAHRPASSAARRQVVELRAGAILFDGHRVSPPHIPRDVSCARTIPPLRALLATARPTLETLVIEIEDPVPFARLCAVVHTASEAGFAEVVLRGATEPRPCRVATRLAPDDPKITALALTVAVGRRGFIVGGVGGVLSHTDGSFPTIPCKGSCLAAPGYDDELLGRGMRAVKTTFPEQREVALTAEHAIPCAAVLRTGRRLRAHFDRVVLISFEEAQGRMRGLLKREADEIKLQSK